MENANKRLKKIVAVFVVLFLALVGVRMATMETELELHTTFEVPEGVSLSEIGTDVSGIKWAVAVDGKVTNENLEVQPTASTTKMILALAVLEKKPLNPGEKGEELEITKEMYEKYGWYLTHNGSNTKVTLGEKISEYDALVSVMLASSNNMADSLAIWAFGSISEYQKYATEMLARMGVENTTLGTKDASGYDKSTTSTAADLAKIGYFVVKEPVLSEIVAKKEAEVPVAGKISNTNKLLGKAEISGVKTGYIGDESGYCIVSGYKSGEHIVTVAVLGAKTRDKSFSENLSVVEGLQEKLVKQGILKKEIEIGYYNSWWTGKIPILTGEDFSEMNYQGAEKRVEVLDEKLKIKIGEKDYEVSLEIPEFSRKPNVFERFLHVFGWKK